MRNNRYRRRMMADINVVPYIDVMLVLLVIFMITAPLLTQGVKVDLPVADADPMQTDAPEPVQITVDKQGDIYFNDEKLEQQVIMAKAAAVKRRNPKVEFVVRGDSEAAYQHVINAMVLLQRAGIEGVGLVTEPGEK
jgi:biopolymer transport protein TolR